ncbi:MAG: amidohydrolase family protein [Acidobacteria bacterium]|nr:amidohydrolase family protein [Acidobacteriota bacterium]
MKIPLHILFGLLLSVASALSAAQPQSYDLIIRGGRIVDGAGNGWFRADVAVRGETIAAIGRLAGATARRVIEARDSIVAPGFIDTHSHSRRTIFEETKAENYIRQGVTTAIEGPDGSSPLPLKPFFKRLDDPATRARVKAAVVESIQFDRGGGASKNVYIARCEWDQSLEGKNLAEITAARGRSTSFEDAAETAMEIIARGGASAIYHAINEDDLVRILKDPMTMIASDGGVQIPGRGVPHPRNYGTFARVLGVYVRERRILSLEDAVRKMTSLPAQRMGLQDRGALRPGMKADIVVFDAARVRDRATFADPHQYAEGFSFVIVNGTIVLDDGKITEARPGQALLGTAAQGVKSVKNRKDGQ